LIKKLLLGVVVLAAGAAIYVYVTVSTGNLRQDLEAHAATLSAISGALAAAERALPDRVKDSAATLEKLRALRGGLARLEPNLEAQTFAKLQGAHILAELTAETSVQLLDASKLAFESYRFVLELLTENHRTLLALLVGDASGGTPDRGKMTDALQRIDSLLEVGDGVTEVIGTHMLELEVRWLELSRDAEKLKSSGAASDESTQLAGTLSRYFVIGGTPLRHALEARRSGEELSKNLREAFAKQKALAGVVR
jgi:hypothetical protein